MERRRVLAIGGLLVIVSAAVAVSMKRRVRKQIEVTVDPVDIDFNDARLQPGAYVRSRQVKPALCMIVETNETMTVLEDANTGDQFPLAPWLVLGQYVLVVAAPASPNYVDDIVTVRGSAV